MTEAIRNRIGPASGVLFFALLMAGAAIHGYPEIRPSDSQLASWLATLDLGRFNTGMYIEALGVLLFMPFATLLYRRLRQGPRDASYPATTMLAASEGCRLLQTKAPCPLDCKPRGKICDFLAEVPARAFRSARAPLESTGAVGTRGYSRHRPPRILAAVSFATEWLRMPKSRMCS